VLDVVSLHSYQK